MKDTTRLNGQSEISTELSPALARRVLLAAQRLGLTPEQIAEKAMESFLLGKTEEEVLRIIEAKKSVSPAA